MTAPEHPTISLSDCGSSQICSYGYDEPSHTLELKFRHGGRRYQYSGVEPETYQAFKKAPSIGAFFHKEIRGHYDYVKLEERKPEEETEQHEQP